MRPDPVVTALDAERLRAAIRAGVDLRHDVRTGRLSVAAALDDPRAAHLHVNAVLDAHPDWPIGRVDTLLILTCRVWPLRSAGDLTDGERARIVAALGEAEGRVA